MYFRHIFFTLWFIHTSIPDVISSTTKKCKLIWNDKCASNEANLRLQTYPPRKGARQLRRRRKGDWPAEWRYHYIRTRGTFRNVLKKDTGWTTQRGWNFLEVYWISQINIRSKRHSNPISLHDSRMCCQLRLQLIRLSTQLCLQLILRLPLVPDAAPHTSWREKSENVQSAPSWFPLCSLKRSIAADPIITKKARWLALLMLLDRSH